MPARTPLPAAIGNRAMGRLLQRTAAGGAGGAAARRVVMLDGLILDQINRGNRQMAEALIALRASGARIVLGTSVTREFLADVPDLQMRQAHVELVRDLGIELDPPDLRGSPEAHAAAHADLAKVSFVSPKDKRVARDAMAAGVELWTTDVTYRSQRKNADKHLKALRLAAESRVPPEPPRHWNYAEGRQLLGLEPITVGKDGAVTRGVAPAAVGSIERAGRIRDAVPGSRVKGDVTVPPAKPEHARPPAAEPKVVVDDPALRGQVRTGTTTTHVHTTAAGEIGGGRPGGGGGGGGGGGAAAKADDTALKAAAKADDAAGLLKRVARKLPGALIDGLIPDPLDVLMLLADFADAAYNGARIEIRRKNLRSGFAIGFAGYLLGATWEYAAHRLADRVISRDVGVQVAGAVGVAENAFNEGLVRGFAYGEKHSAAQLGRALDRSFAALRRAGKTIGTETGFNQDDVYVLAAVLLPTADAVLAEAARRRAARLKAERERERRDDWTRPVGNKI